MRGICVYPLARRLRAAGHVVETFDYASVFGGVEAAAARLRERMCSLAAHAVHLVGHSLGGLVALEAVRGAHDVPEGRIVCVGSPLRSSAMARRMVAMPGARALLGRSAPVLTHGVDAWLESRRVGVIAGTRPLGLGAVIGALDSPHDGTVAVEETRLSGITDHCTVAASHMGLLFSSEVADRAIGFLRDGHFASNRFAPGPVR